MTDIDEILIIRTERQFHILSIWKTGTLVQLVGVFWKLWEMGGGGMLWLVIDGGVRLLCYSSA